MKSNLPNSKTLTGKPVLKSLFEIISSEFAQTEETHGLFNYPLCQADDGTMLSLDAVIISPLFGVWVINTIQPADARAQIVDRQEQIVSTVYSKLIKNPALRKSKLALKFGFLEVLFDPTGLIKGNSGDAPICRTRADFSALIPGCEGMPDVQVAREAVATLNGSKAIIRCKEREEIEGAARKGNVAKQLECEMALLDQDQERGGTILINGPQRIRGIAGTGKTVVLAMKAALAHLNNPKATIVYTFYTKTLYQHVKRLITRFYRQFSDQDPDWSKLLVMHAWGGRAYPGVYYNVCRELGLPAKTFSEAIANIRRIQSNMGTFDYICREVLQSRAIKPVFDFLFIDEGQDFPNSFIDLCRQCTANGRIAWAYDEMQNIFDVSIPTQLDVFGRNEDGSPKATIEDDSILYRSYRNPREILTAAHALGFGIYSPHIVQMLESKQHWEDLGYRVLQGDFIPGAVVAVERNPIYSSSTISAQYGYDEIISCSVYPGINEETAAVVEEILACIEDGLRPDDILVAIVDDRNAKTYSGLIESLLLKEGVASHSVYNDKFDIVDFNLEQSVTISTVNKAKGNEAFQVFVVGVDALFFDNTPQSRNRLFTALTRAKGWVRVSGVGDYAMACQKEMDAIRSDFPAMKFAYPDPAQIKIMQRDLSEEGRRKLTAQRQLEEIRAVLSPEEIKAFLEREK